MYNIEELKEKTDCRDVAQSLLGQPIRSTSKRILYSCPFHKENHGSFWVYEDGYTCYGQCNESGTVIDLVMKVKGLDLKAACDYLGGSQFVSETPRPKITRPEEPEPPSGEWQKSAWDTMQAAFVMLNRQTGIPAMRYLTEVRKLEPWVVWYYNLGYIPLPTKAAHQVTWVNSFGVAAPCGITLPHIDPQNNLWGVRVRLPKPPKPVNTPPEKYSSFKGGKLKGGLFGGSKFKPELPVYLDEGEFNALSVMGCIYDMDTPRLCSLALGSVNNDLSKSWLDRLLFSPVVFIRTDSGSGDKVAEQLLALSKRFVRVQVPEPYKDPNELLMKEGKPALIEWVRGFLK